MSKNIDEALLKLGPFVEYDRFKYGEGIVETRNTEITKWGHRNFKIEGTFNYLKKMANGGTIDSAPVRIRATTFGGKYTVDVAANTIVTQIVVSSSQELKEKLNQIFDLGGVTKYDSARSNRSFATVLTKFINKLE